MKFQDDISNMNTYIHTYVRTYIHTYIRTYIRTSRNEYAPPLFQSWGHNEGARVLTRLYDVFSDAQGQLTPKSAAELCRNSNLSKLL